MIARRPVILLVEDDAAHAELIMRSIETKECPLNVVHLLDGASAIEFLKGLICNSPVARTPVHPSLIILDLSLPKIGGLEVLEWIKGHEPLTGIPVVILTTSADQKDLAQAYHHRANSYLVKPTDFDEFSSLMKKLTQYWLQVNQCVV